MIAVLEYGADVMNVKIVRKYVLQGAVKGDKGIRRGTAGKEVAHAHRRGVWQHVGFEDLELMAVCSGFVLGEVRFRPSEDFDLVTYLAHVGGTLDRIRSHVDQRKKHVPGQDRKEALRNCWRDYDYAIDLERNAIAVLLASRSQFGR